MPQIARFADRRLIEGRRHHIGGIGVATGRHRQPFDAKIDFAHGEARGFEVEIELDRGEIAQNLAQELIVPARGLGEAIVGDAEGACLFAGQVLEADDGDIAQAQPSCRMDAAVASEDLAVLIGQDRNVEPKRFDAARDLLDLPVAVQSRVARIHLQALDRDTLDQKLASGIRLAARAPPATPPFGRPTEIVSS
jgi:hypothetical protein